MWSLDDNQAVEVVMCGGIYEEDFEDAPRTGKQAPKKVESSNGGMNDLKFTTAADFMKEQDNYYYPGSDPQE
jgi:hypothetical protein